MQILFGLTDQSSGYFLRKILIIGPQFQAASFPYFFTMFTSTSRYNWLINDTKKIETILLINSYTNKLIGIPCHISADFQNSTRATNF